MQREDGFTVYDTENTVDSIQHGPDTPGGRVLPILAGPYASFVWVRWSLPWRFQHSRKASIYKVHHSEKMSVYLRQGLRGLNGCNGCVKGRE